MTTCLGPRRHLDRSREARLKRIEVAVRMVRSRLPVRVIAEFYGVTRMTCYRWYHLALTYDDPEADVLRGLIRERGEA